MVRQPSLDLPNYPHTWHRYCSDMSEMQNAARHSSELLFRTLIAPVSRVILSAVRAGIIDPSDGELVVSLLEEPSAVTGTPHEVIRYPATMTYNARHFSLHEKAKLKLK